MPPRTKWGGPSPLHQGPGAGGPGRMMELRGTQKEEACGGVPHFQAAGRWNQVWSWGVGRVINGQGLGYGALERAVQEGADPPASTVPDLSRRIQESSSLGKSTLLCGVGDAGTGVILIPCFEYLSSSSPAGSGLEASHPWERPGVNYCQHC